jgi:hypothetical protein
VLCIMAQHFGAMIRGHSQCLSQSKSKSKSRSRSRSRYRSRSKSKSKPPVVQLLKKFPAFYGT